MLAPAAAPPPLPLIDDVGAGLAARLGGDDAAVVEALMVLHTVTTALAAFMDMERLHALAAAAAVAQLEVLRADATVIPREGPRPTSMDWYENILMRTNNPDFVRSLRITPRMFNRWAKRLEEDPAMTRSYPGALPMIPVRVGLALTLRHAAGMPPGLLTSTTCSGSDSQQSML